MDISDSLLGLLVDEKVIAILKERLTPEQVADLVLEKINPYYRISTEKQADLAGLSARQMRDRKAGRVKRQ